MLYVLGAGRDSRYSGARRGIGHQGVLGAARGCWGHYEGLRGIRGCRGIKGVLGAGRDCRYSGVRRGIGGIRGIGGF